MKKKAFYLLLLVFVLGACEKNEIPEPVPEPAINYPDFMIAGYLPYYSFDRFNLNYLNTLDRLYYFSVAPDAKGNFFYNSADVSNLNQLKENNLTGETEVYLVIGGWYESENIHVMAANLNLRNKYIEEVTAFCIDHGLHGIDLDWEDYPKDVNQDDYLDLVKGLSQLLRAKGLGFSVAVAASHTEQAFRFNNYVDEFNIMSYGTLDAGGNQVPMSMFTGWLQNFVQKGIPKNKLIGGVPFYGKRPYIEGDDLPRAVTYRAIVAQMSPAPLLNKYNNYGFNGRAMIKNKALYLAQSGYKGIMTWELSQDVDYSSDFSLLKAMCDAVHPE